MELNCEAFTWLMTLSASERRAIWRKLATGLWKLKWNAAEHTFELKQLP